MHSTTITRIDNKEVEIDLEILPIVQWLNSFPSTKTTDSCQGDKSRGDCGLFSDGAYYGSAGTVSAETIKKYIEEQKLNEH